MESEVLLAPLPLASPCGDDYSFSTEFDRIAEMRRADDASLNQGEWVTSLKVSDWPGVADACTQLLQTKTKDLRVAMWLTEAWALNRGYAGLAQGMHVCAELCRQYWDALHPQNDGGDHDERVGNMRWLLQRIVHLAPRLPIVQGHTHGTYSLHDWALASQQTITPATSQTAPPSASPDLVSMDQFQRALRETTHDSLRSTLEAAQACHTTLLAWQKLIDERLGNEGPSFVAAKEALANAVHDIERFAKERGALTLTPSPSATTAKSDTELTDHAMTTSHVTHRVTHVAQAVATRAQALQQLKEVAQFFRQTEPHSPVAYLAEKAVKWGEMPLHEWLSHVIKDQGAMNHLEELLGFQAQRSE